MNRRRLLFGPLAILLAVLLAVILAEVAVRVIRPTPRVQVVRLKGLGSPAYTEVIGNSPIWWQEKEENRARLHNLTCQQDKEDPYTVVMLGSSILGGIGLPVDDIFSIKLQPRLEARRPSCVHNFSGPGFTFQAELATAKKFIPQTKPNLVFLEVWNTSPFDYTVLNNNAYAFSAFVVDEQGLPNVFGLAPSTNRRLFLLSRLYEYATLSLARQNETSAEKDWTHLADERLQELYDLCREHQAELVLVFAPRLDRSFDEHIRLQGTGWETDPHAPYDYVEAFARRQGLRTFRLEKELQQYAVEEVRLDECCHYNSQGHEALVDVFFRQAKVNMTEHP
ncbi:MAG: hypothetical protein HN348_01860 [Proteobacteria bacterium]|nr:hypothetical protein [Pseudomonadota bacterium]